MGVEKSILLKIILHVLIPRLNHGAFYDGPTTKELYDKIDNGICEMFKNLLPEDIKSLESCSL